MKKGLLPKHNRSNLDEFGKIINPTLCGIYKITCLVNNKILVGQSQNFPFRVDAHQSQLKSNRHYNIFIQRAYNKYGVDNFTYQMIECCPIENLNDREIFWISELNTMDDSFGYNLIPGGQLITGRDYIKYIGQEITCNGCNKKFNRLVWGRYSGYCIECADKHKSINKIKAREKAKLKAREDRKRKGCKPRDVNKVKQITYKIGDICSCKGCSSQFVKESMGLYSQYCRKCACDLISQTRQKRLLQGRERAKKYRIDNKELVAIRDKERRKRVPSKPLSLEQKKKAAERLRQARKANPDQFKKYEHKRDKTKRKEQKRQNYLKNKKI